MTYWVSIAVVSILIGCSSANKPSGSTVNQIESPSVVGDEKDALSTQTQAEIEATAASESPSDNSTEDTAEAPVGPAPTLSITSAAAVTKINHQTYSVVGECSEEGQDVTVSISSIEGITSCSSGVFFINGLDISTLPDGTLTVQASQFSHESVQGNTEISVLKLTASPTVAFSSNGNIDQSNQGAYTISGTCSEAGQNVAISFAGSLNFSANCSAGTWRLENIDVSSLVDNASISITADHSSSDATPAPQASTSVAKDSLAPTVTIAQPDTINANNESAYLISGTCSENSQAIDLTIGNIAISTSCNNRVWNSGFTDVSTLEDGSIMITADHKNALDQAANTASVVVTKATSIPTVSFLSIPVTLTNTIQASWELVNPSEMTITDHIIQYRLEGSSTWLTYNDGVSTSTSVQINGLSASTRYEVRVQVQYSDGSDFMWSEAVVGETKPDNELFNSPYKAMNVGGATEATVVAFENDTVVTLNGSPLKTLSQGETHLFATAQFDVIDADKPIYTSGRRGNSNAAATEKGNITFMPSHWAGKTFSLNATRTSDQKVAVYAIEDTTVNAYLAGVLKDTISLEAGNGGELVWPDYGSVQIVSTGTILAYHYSAGPGNKVTDPKPLLPSSTEIIGIPSKRMQLTADLDSTFYTHVDSASNSGSSSLNKQDMRQLNATGNRSLYQSNSLLISSSQGISGASYADNNGNCASIFLPTNLMKTKYVINVNSDWVAFASKEDGVISVYSPSQTIGVDTPVATIELDQSGSANNAPFKGYATGHLAGYRYVSDVPVAAWYQPSTNVGASKDDETVLYGSD